METLQHCTLPKHKDAELNCVRTCDCTCMAQGSGCQSGSGGQVAAPAVHTSTACCKAARPPGFELLAQGDTRTQFISALRGGGWAFMVAIGRWEGSKWAIPRQCFGAAPPQEPAEQVGVLEGVAELVVVVPGPAVVLRRTVVHTHYAASKA
jgi:hypothetical protein